MRKPLFNLAALFKESLAPKAVNVQQPGMKKHQTALVPQDSSKQTHQPVSILASFALKPRKTKEADSATSFGQTLRSDVKEGGPGSGPSGGGAHRSGDHPKYGKIIHKPERTSSLVSKSQDAKLSKANSFTKALTSHFSAKPRESQVHNFKIMHSFMESDSEIAPSRYLTVLISEGLGNGKDGFYYTAAALKSAAPLFDGQKCYANHPSSVEEEVLPERDVRDIIGHFENVRAVPNGDHLEIQADLVVMAGASYDWVRAQLVHALEFSQKYTDKDFIGLSINAGGSATPQPIDLFLKSAPIPDSCRPKVEQAAENGLQFVRVVEEIKEAISCDLVTQAGAGGRVVQAI